MNKQNGSVRPIAVYYEHPDWFRKLFDELDARNIAYEKMEAHNHRFDPSETESTYSVIVNRMSPSAWARGHTHAIPYTLEYFAHLKAIGANVINGYEAYLHEFSKVRQTRLLKALGANHPRSRVINHPSQALAAAEGFSFPVITKANIGGSGAGIQKYDTPVGVAQAYKSTIHLKNSSKRPIMRVSISVSIVWLSFRNIFHPAENKSSGSRY